jgi:hypothetical protein
MANRTTATDVKLILDTDLDDPIVEAFISDANPIVTDVLGSDTSLSSAQKASIEKWLTAHFIACTRDQQAQREEADEAAIVYQGKTAMGLDATYYGQQVKVLDTTGKMAKALGKRRVTITAITSFE